LGDPEIEERDQEGDQHPGDPAEQRGEDDADHRVGERDTSPLSRRVSASAATRYVGIIESPAGRGLL